jgi:transposase InsO family protein
LPEGSLQREKITKEEEPMDEEHKKQMAVFRFGAIADLVGGVKLERGEREHLIREKCERKWVIPYSGRSRLTRTTIRRWIRKYDGRLESLYPEDRTDTGQCRVLDEETRLALLEARKGYPKASVRKLIEQLEQGGWGRLSPTTAYRFLRDRGLMKAQQMVPEDRRKFEAELPNDLWQSDVLHGPLVESGGKKRKSYLIAFIDDYSRLVPYGEFYPGETLAFYLKALEQALATRGLPRKIYVDNGAAFRSHHLEQVTAALGIALIHARPYKPQGKGKIERWFKTVRSDFLSGFRGTTLSELNQAFEIWLREVYHQRKHGATGQAPFERFAARMECLRPAPGNLRDSFRQTVRRRVAKDRTISLNGKLFEAPVGLIGQQVTLRYHEANLEQIEVVWNNQSYGFLSLVNLQINSRVKRDKDNRLVLETTGRSAYHGGALWERSPSS